MWGASNASPSAGSRTQGPGEFLSGKNIPVGLQHPPDGPKGPSQRPLWLVFDAGPSGKPGEL